ncbi:MAG TPA: GntR family transcriptional regulator [Acidimicrobiia bacterium]
MGAAPDGRTSAADRLRDDILGGVLPPGGRLIEVQLAERYGVGRSAVRAALVELDTEGLVQREANRGATVRRVSVIEAIEITEARAALEGLVARRAAERATDAERAELRELIESMEAAVESGGLAHYSTLNRTLHRRLAECSRHEIAEELIANLRNRAAHHQFRLATVAGRAGESLPQHRAIVDAVVAGDGDAADAAMRAHLDSVVSVLRHWGELGVSV